MLYVLCEPIHAPLASKVGPKVAALAVVVGVLLLVLVPGTWFAGLIIDQAPAALARFQDADVVARLSSFRLGNIDVGSRIAEASDAITSWFSRQALSVVGGATRAILNMVIALFGLYYLLCRATEAWAWASRYIPFSPASTLKLAERFVSVTKSTVIGTIAVAILQGSIVGFGFLTVGLPNAVFWGVITAMVSVLPVMGSALVWFPAVLVLLADGRVGNAIALAAIGGLVASNVDNVIRPIINKQRSDVHPLITIVGAFAGVQALGLMGLLVGPLAIVYFFELLRIYGEEYAATSSARPTAPAPPENDSRP